MLHSSNFPRSLEGNGYEIHEKLATTFPNVMKPRESYTEVSTHV